MPEVHSIESLVYGLAVWDTLTELPRGQRMEEVRAAKLERFLPAWFDPVSGRVKIDLFFYCVGLQVSHDYLNPESLERYLSSFSGGKQTIADIVGRIRGEQPHQKEPELLGVNTLLVQEARKLCGSWMPTPTAYLLALSEVAQNVGPGVFEKIYDVNNPVFLGGSSDYQAYRKIRNGGIVSFCRDLITAAPQWETEVTCDDDGTLPESEMLKKLSSQDRFIDPVLVEKVNTLYRHSLLV